MAVPARSSSSSSAPCTKPASNAQHAVPSPPGPSQPPPPHPLTPSHHQPPLHPTAGVQAVRKDIVIGMAATSTRPKQAVDAPAGNITLLCLADSLMRAEGVTPTRYNSAARKAFAARRRPKQEDTMPMWPMASDAPVDLYMPPDAPEGPWQNPSPTPIPVDPVDTPSPSPRNDTANVTISPGYNAGALASATCTPTCCAVLLLCCWVSAESPTRPAAPLQCPTCHQHILPRHQRQMVSGDTPCAAAASRAVLPRLMLSPMPCPPQMAAWASPPRPSPTASA